MVRRLPHHPPYGQDKSIADFFMKEIAHGIDKNLLRFLPRIRDDERLMILADDTFPNGPLAALAG
jgi:hypothetical protein